MEFDAKVVIKIDDPTFPRNILKKAYESEWLVDVTLITEVDSTRITAHRIVLATASEYFSAMFTTDMMEKNQKRIEIKEVTGESLKSLVSYCYSGQIEINSQNVVGLLAAASMMRFEKIEIQCKEFFEKQLKASPKASFSIHFIAQRYSFAELAKNSLKRICERFDILSKSPRFIEIDFSLMEQILDSDDLFNVTEEDIFEAAMKWINFDTNERQQFIPNILKLIRLTQIHPTYLFEKVQPICESNNCSRLVTTALYWKFMPEQQRLGLLPVKQTTKRTTSMKILVIGTNTPSDVIRMETYCSRSKKWISCEEMKCPMQTTGARLAVIDETVYVTGENVFSCDLRTLKITPLPSMQTARKHHGFAVNSNGLYVIGGYSAAGSCVSSVECYDLNTNEWKSCKAMLTVRTEFDVAFLNDYLYAIGGYDGSMYLNSIERYSPSNDTWSSVKPMNNRRCQPGVGVLNGKIYVAGGYAGGSARDSVEYYDPNTDIWGLRRRGYIKKKQRASYITNRQKCFFIVSLSTSRYGVAVAVYENEIFAIGGYETTIVERYDANDDKWLTIEPLNCCRSVSSTGPL